MATANQQALREELSRLRSRIDSVEAELAREDFPTEDPCRRNQILVWDRVLSGKTYTYVAHKADNGLWYLTGQNSGSYTWAQLVTEHFEKPRVSNFRHANLMYFSRNTDLNKAVNARS